MQHPRYIYFFALAVAVPLLSGTALAHSGGTDAYGCHNDNIHGGYHCHNGGSSEGGGSTGGGIQLDYNDDDDALHYNMMNAPTYSTSWCRSRYGDGALGSIGKCNCKGGYKWNDDKTACVSDGTYQEPTDRERLQRRLQQHAQSSDTGDAATINTVIDGDTIVVNIDNTTEKVRIIGIDTPETVDPRKPVQCFGREASAKLKELLTNKTVTLTANPAEDRDKYDRLLRYVEVDGVDIGAQMIEEGYAFSYKAFPHPRLNTYNALERSAREAGKGLWSACEHDEAFTDIPDTHPYRDAIAWGRQRQVISGYPDGSFKPDRTVNRAEFLKIVLEGKGIDVTNEGSNTDFTDVPANAWFAPYVQYAKEHGIIQGYSDGTFKPDRTVNFAEALKMAYETLDVAGDTSETGEWYAKYLHHAKRRSVLFRSDISVDSDMSRKDVVWIVWRLSNGVGEADASAGTCDIKGNISYETEEKIYHAPGCQSYNATVINEAKGERFFCTEAEARAAGWRKALNCP